MRRGLALAGAGAAMALLAGAAWRLVSAKRAEAAAREPWRTFANRRGLERLVHAATLAANAHNTQPWRFAIEDDRIEVYADLERNIGSFDAIRRELHVSLGCAIENIVIQAAAEGIDVGVEVTAGRLPPRTNRDPVAVLTLSAAAAGCSDLVRGISQRRTHRGAYDRGRVVPDAVIAKFQKAAMDFPQTQLTVLTGDRAVALGEQIVASTRDILADKAMAADNARWYRFTPEALHAHRDGLTLDANIISPVMNLAAHLIQPSSTMANKSWLKDTKQVHVATAPMLGLITIRDLHDVEAVIAAGRLWQRLHLIATCEGLAAQPLNQSAERVDREAQLGQTPRTAEALARIIGSADRKPTFFFRMGYPLRPAAHSPRRVLAEVIGRPRATLHAIGFSSLERGLPNTRLSVDGALPDGLGGSLLRLARALRGLLRSRIREPDRPRRVHDRSLPVA